MVMLVGLADKVKSAGMATKTAAEVEPTYLVSPLYWAVTDALAVKVVVRVAVNEA